MAGIVWQYDGYRKLVYGTQAYRDGLSDHIKEVTQVQAAGSYTVQGKAHSIDLGSYIQMLKDEWDALKAAPVTPSTTEEPTYFARGVLP